MTELFTVGKSEIRKDALPKACGAAVYVDDCAPAGTLYAAAVRSAHPHILIEELDFSEAAAVSGFAASITAKDIPGKNQWPLVKNDYPFLPEKEAKFCGETLAIVVADTRHAAVEAARRTRVAFRKLEFVTDPLAAMEPSAPKVHGENNIISSYRVKRGDAEEAIRSADAVVEAVYTANYQAHVYLETQGALAVPENGAMTIYTSTQCPFYVHDAVACVLGVPQNMVRVVQRVTGGGFGGKEDVPALVAAHAALAARKTGRPVKLIYERDEDFLSMSKRHPAWMKVLYAARRDGKITACRVKYVLDGGAYATLSPIVLWRGTVHATGPYVLDNLLVETFAAATNKVPCGAYRGFGQPQISFATESLIDELAAKLGMDPVELRLKNILRPGDKTACGQTVSQSCGLEEALLEARRRAGPPKPGRGTGFSVSYYGVGLGAGGKYLDRAGAAVTVFKDGSAQVAVGNTEMGQGAQTVLAQIAAESLNAPYCAVRVSEVDTALVPDSGPTVASRTTLMAGNAVLEACSPLRERLFSAARDLLSAKGAPAGEMAASNGVFSAGGAAVSFAEAAAECWGRRLKMAEHGWYIAPPTSYNSEDGQGVPYVIYAYSANAAEVSVDRETGEIRVEKLICAHDMGKAVNPQLTEGQMQGGALQGMGYAVCENLVLKDGVMQNPNMTDYLVPSAEQTPEFDCAIIERGYEQGPYNAKGFGEAPLIAVAPAVANAVFAACGARLRELPMLPEKLWKALQK
ncbi:MAG: xanthine dehydrogenase family protein molybdopterin-binding subunit [Elusimicrobiales bacterium]